MKEEFKHYLYNCIESMHIEQEKLNEEDLKNEWEPELQAPFIISSNKKKEFGKFCRIVYDKDWQIG